MSPANAIVMAERIDAHLVFGLLWMLGLFIVSLVLYLTPSIVAFSRQHHRFWFILALNVFLGWTFLGWIGALAWALLPVPAERRRHPWRKRAEAQTVAE